MHKKTQIVMTGSEMKKTYEVIFSNALTMKDCSMQCIFGILANPFPNVSGNELSLTFSWNNALHIILQCGITKAK